MVVKHAGIFTASVLATVLKVRCSYLKTTRVGRSFLEKTLPAPQPHELSCSSPTTLPLTEGREEGNPPPFDPHEPPLSSHQPPTSFSHREKGEGVINYLRRPGSTDQARVQRHAGAFFLRLYIICLRI